MNSILVIHIGRLVGNWKADPHYVYIGRPSSLGNPFVIGKHGTRDEVISKYERWLIDQMDTQGPVSVEIARIRKLLKTDSVTLVCYCAPKRCHGDAIAEYIEMSIQAQHLLNVQGN